MSEYRLAYVYRLYPTKAQETALAGTLETCRQVYNSLLNWRKHDHEVLGKSPSKVEQQAAFPRWKKEHAELSDVYSQVLQNVAVRVDLAFDAFFRRVKAGETPGFPRIKSHGQYDSITYPQSGFGVVQGRLRLSKIGDLAIRLHRPIDGDIKTCTVRRVRHKWYACLSCEVGAELLPPSNEEVGIDVGLKTFASLSNGENVENPPSSAGTRRLWRRHSASWQSGLAARRHGARPVRLSPVSTSVSVTGAMISFTRPPEGWSTATA